MLTLKEMLEFIGMGLQMTFIGIILILILVGVTDAAFCVYERIAGTGVAPAVKAEKNP